MDCWSFGVLKSIKIVTNFKVVIWETVEMKTPYNSVLSNEEVATRVCDGSLRLPDPSTC
jgi:hypothetical protein